VYCLVNEHNKSVAALWDGHDLRCTFCRYVDIRLFNMWEEVVSLTSTIVLSEDDDEMIWQFQSLRIYSSQSLYSVINFRGVTPVYVLGWKLIVPLRVHFFLWS
jgi:hypothetical protein